MRKLKLRRDLAEKTYDITKPAIASDGTVNKEMQKKYFNLVATLRGIKTPPSLWTVFDFSLVRKITAELKAKGWKPGR